MATKAQQFRAAVERSGTKKAKKVVKVKAVGRLTHNDAHRADKHSAYAIEPGLRPSRKSTRGSSNRSKTDSALRITARVKNASPKARAGRKSGNPM